MTQTPHSTCPQDPRGPQPLDPQTPDHQTPGETQTLLSKALARSYPDHALVALCEVVNPVYLLRLSVEVLERRDLSTMASYVGGAIQLGAGRPQELSRLLGVDERAIAGGAAELLQRGLAKQRDAREDELGPGVAPPLQLTPLGERALREGGLPTPRSVSLRLFYNALTLELDAVDDTAWPPDVLAREGLPILPGMRATPTLADLDEAAVAAARKRAYPKAQGELMRLVDLRKPQPRYLPHHTVAQQRHRRTREERVVVARRGVVLPQETTALQRLFMSGDWRLPEDCQEVDAAPPLRAGASYVTAGVGVTSAPGQSAIERLEALERVADRLRADVGVASAQEAQEKMARERQPDLDRLRNVEEENARLRAQLGQRQVTFLAMEEHRPLLERGLRDARVEALIISPWMNRRACDDVFCQLVADALRRGVRIRIRHGIENAQRPVYTLNPREREERDRGEANTRAVIEALYRVAPLGSERLLEIRQAPRGTHEKILVIDPEDGGFACVTSFNWLSYRGGEDAGSRREIGTLVQDPRDVRQVAQRAREALGDAP